MRLHRGIRQCWHNRQQHSFGPQKESILKSSAFSTRLLLEKFDAPSVVNWYERLVSTCEAFRIGLVPFDAIQFGCRHEGLCLPGLGFERYDDMASALCTAMPICLDKADGRVRAMVSGVETKTRNGYKIVWNLLFRYVPGFDPTKTVNKPRWDMHEGYVIQYAAAFDLYFRLSAKRGNTRSQFNKSILFLKGITARNLMKIVEPLIIAIEGMQGEDDAGDGGLPIGYLPYHLRVDELAQKIADRCKVEPFDRELGGRPRVHNLMIGDEPPHPLSDSDDEHYAEPLDGHMQGYNVPTVAQARKPNGQPGQKLVTDSSDFTPAAIITSPLPPPQPPPQSIASPLPPLQPPPDSPLFHPTLPTDTDFRVHPPTDASSPVDMPDASSPIPPDTPHNIGQCG